MALDDDSDFEVSAPKAKKSAVQKQTVITKFAKGPKVNPLATKSKSFDGGSSDAESFGTPASSADEPIKQSFCYGKAIQKGSRSS